MRLVLKHVQHNPQTGSWTYRRGIPEALRGLLGKSEQKKKLGSTEAEAIRNYHKVHKAFDADLTMARLELAKQEITDDAPNTPYAAYRKALEIFRSLGFDPDTDGLDPEDIGDAQEAIARGVLVGQIGDKYPEDPDTGHPVGVEPVDTQLVRLLNSDTPVTPPPPTFLDAVEAYIDTKIRSERDEEQKEQRMRRVAGYATNAWNGDRLLNSLGYYDGQAVLNDMEKTTTQSAATRRRYLNDLSAIVNQGILVLGVKDATNPFKSLTIKQEGRAQDRRRSFTASELIAIRARVLTSANHELCLIWRLMEGTGCRTKEIMGLEVEDIKLTGNIPHLDICENEIRGLKNKNSDRVVPLIGDALEAAREAIRQAGDKGPVFPRYANSKRGSDAVSAALNKHVRAIIPNDKKAVLYSLRHTMKDRLRLAAINTAMQESLMGHGKQKISETYGGYNYLSQAAIALEKALDTVLTED